MGRTRGALTAEDVRSQGPGGGASGNLTVWVEDSIFGRVGGSGATVTVARPQLNGNFD